MIGVVLEVDMKLFRKDDIVRIKVGVKFVSLIPPVVELTVEMFYFDTFFELEQVVEVGGIFGSNLKRGDEDKDKQARKEEEQDRENKRHRNLEKDKTVKFAASGSGGKEGNQLELQADGVEEVDPKEIEKMVFDRLVQLEVDRQVNKILQEREETMLREKLLKARKEVDFKLLKGNQQGGIGGTTLSETGNNFVGLSGDDKSKELMEQSKDVSESFAMRVQGVQGQQLHLTELSQKDDEEVNQEDNFVSDNGELNTEADKEAPLRRSLRLEQQGQVDARVEDRGYSPCQGEESGDPQRLSGVR